MNIYRVTECGLVTMASAGDITGAETKGQEINTGIPSPGELVLKKLFAQFVVYSQSKLNYVMSQPLVSDSILTLEYIYCLSILG